MEEEALSRDWETPSGDIPPCEDGFWVFNRLRVRPSIAHGTIVDWLLDPSFTDPEPHTFQLQWGQTDSNASEDWEDVGMPVVDAFSITDTEQRAFGDVQRTFYRVRLTT